MNLREELKRHSIAISEKINLSSPEQLRYPLPFSIRPEKVNSLTETEIRERISYSKERSDFYNKMFNDKGSSEVERVFFQSCCEYHMTRLFVAETMLEKFKL